MNYFEYYGIPVVYFIDLNDLRSKFYASSKKIQLESDISQIQKNSAYNNEAYRILKSPLLLLKYILEQYDCAIQENPNDLDQEFLMAMMDWHEQILEAHQLNDKEKIVYLNSQLESARKELEVQHFEILQAIPACLTQQNNISRLKEYYYKLKYFFRLQQALEKETAEL